MDELLSETTKQIFETGTILVMKAIPYNLDFDTSYLVKSFISNMVSIGLPCEVVNEIRGDWGIHTYIRVMDSFNPRTLALSFPQKYIPDVVSDAEDQFFLVSFYIGEDMFWLLYDVGQGLYRDIGFNPINNIELAD